MPEGALLIAPIANPTKRVKAALLVEDGMFMVAVPSGQWAPGEGEDFLCWEAAMPDAAPTRAQAGRDITRDEPTRTFGPVPITLFEMKRRQRKLS